MALCTQATSSVGGSLLFQGSGVALPRAVAHPPTGVRLARTRTPLQVRCYVAAMQLAMRRFVGSSLLLTPPCLVRHWVVFEALGRA
jgi:hypothetical protein